MPAQRRDRSAASDASPRRQAKQPGHVQFPHAILPPQLTSFIGRERELSEVAHLLNSTRLLTLIGVGGCGKTRLALQLAIGQADAFEDGVCWVDLAGLAEPALVAQSVAQALSLRETSRESLLETLAAYLETKRLLLILDNCEHLLPACRELVQALLLACPTLKVLATSREPLALVSGTSWLVPALSLPDAAQLLQHNNSLLSGLGHYDAVRLFVERAQAVLTNFTLTKQNQMAVAQVCQRLDGMPLAIELAAARVNVLAVQQIAERLDDRFALLTHGNRTALIPRHQTLRATMDWSHDLLSEPERILFRRLSVFAGGFILEAAEAIGAGNGLHNQDVLDLLSQLIDKSLIVADTQGHSEARYRLLETIRQYAYTKLFESGEAEAVRRRHLEFFIQLAQTAEAQLGGAEQVQWLDRLEPDHDNFRAALKWSADTGLAFVGLQLAVALQSVWCVRGSYSEGWQHFAALLSRPEALERTAARAKALNAAALLLPWGSSNYPTVLALLEESLAIGREIGDRVAIAQSLTLSSLAALSRGGYAAAQSFAEEGLPLWRELNNEAGVATILADLGDAMTYQNNDGQAQVHYEESLSLFTELNDKNQMAYVFRRQGLAALHQGSLRKAAELCGESLALNQAIGSHSGIIASIAALAAVSIAQNNAAYATRLLGAVDTLLASDNVQIMALDRSQSDRTLAAAQAQLSEATFAQAWAEGQAMTLDQAINEAMKVVLPSSNARARDAVLIEPLNEREREMLQLIANGLSNHEIADRLVIALSTVKWHINNLFGKLGVRSRTQALARAKELGLL